MTEQVEASFISSAEEQISWVVTGLRLTERLNSPYEMIVVLSTDDPMAEPANLLGSSATMVFERAGFERRVHGIVCEVADAEATEEETVSTTVKVVPALEVLRHRRNSRIFPEGATIDEVIVDVLGAGLGAYERSVDDGYLSLQYPAQEYTVQYQESDLAFVHRMMEVYGIGYHFDHSGEHEKLVLFDDDSTYVQLQSLGNPDGVVALTLLEGGAEDQEDVRSFSRKLALRPTVARTMLFDWLDPAALTSLAADASNGLGVPNGASIGPEREDYEHVEPSTTYGYRSDGLDVAAATRQVELRRELQQRDALTFVGRTTATQMRPGTYFELTDHSEAALNDEYLVTAVVHELGDLVSEDFDENYINRIECLPREVRWRPDRVTPRPKIAGVQTAVVVGPPGEEIHTDAHGRIKVQFAWDRRQLYDESASCFVRVVQPWAGDGWGFTFLPRIGMEVAVTFIDGDVERPVVTGSLYDGTHATPYSLPEDRTKSTIRTRSSPGGQGFNELRFEDAAGAEEIYVHAQRDYNEDILHDHNTEVGNHRTETVQGHKHTAVHGGESRLVVGDKHETVTQSYTLTVLGGFNLIDPTATEQIHNSIVSTVGFSTSVTGQSISTTGSSIDFTGFSASNTGIKIDTTGIKIDTAGAVLANTPLDIKQVATSIANRSLDLSMGDLVIMM